MSNQENNGFLSPEDAAEVQSRLDADRTHAGQELNYGPELAEVSSNLVDEPQIHKAPVESPKVEVVVSDRRRMPGPVKKLVAIGAAGLTLAGGVFYLKERLPGFPDISADSDHKVEAEFDNVETIIAQRKTINFAKLTASYDYTQKLSLDRPGPSNCDTKIEDNVESTTYAEILLQDSKITIDHDNKKAFIDIRGDITLGGIIDSEEPEIDISTGFIDTCVKPANHEDIGDHIDSLDNTELLEYIEDEENSYYFVEEDWAKLFAEVNLRNANDVAFACTLLDHGESMLAEAIKYEALVFSEKLNGIEPENIYVSFSNGTYAEKLGKIQSNAAKKLMSDFERVAHMYYEVTDDHKPIETDVSDTDNGKLDTEAITECSKIKTSIED